MAILEREGPRFAMLSAILLMLRRPASKLTGWRWGGAIVRWALAWA